MISQSTGILTTETLGRVVGFLPGGDTHRCAANIIENGEALHLQCCFTYDSDSEMLTAALTTAGLKGKADSQIVGDRNHHSSGATYNVPPTLLECSQNGCKMYPCKPPQGCMHVKFLLVDDIAILGSTNWT